MTRSSSNITLAGAALSYGRIVTGSLWLPIAYHFSWNLFQGSVFGMPVSGVRYGGLLAAMDQAAASLFTGGSFGPEGGLIGTLAVFSAFPVFWLWGHRQGSALARNPIDSGASTSDGQVR